MLLEPNFGRSYFLGFNHLLSVVYSGDYAPSIYCDDEALDLEEREENGEGMLPSLPTLLFITYPFILTHPVF